VVAECWFDPAAPVTVMGGWGRIKKDFLLK